MSLVVVVGEVARALVLSVLGRGDAGSPKSGVSLSFLLPNTRFRKPPWVEALLSVVPASLKDVIEVGLVIVRRGVEVGQEDCVPKQSG